MNIDYLIIGQGISGTWLSYYLQKEDRSFLVIDNNDANASSRLAAGIINPVTGRRHASTWMAEEVLPFARQAYNHLGHELAIETITQKDIIDFFPSPQMRLSFTQRVEEKADYVFLPPDQNLFTSHFNYEFGWGKIKPVYTALLENLLPAWRKHLYEKGLLREEEFNFDFLQVNAGHIIYKDITAAKILFCDGNASSSNPYFDLLPFAPNKGEMLITEIPDLAPGHIYKKGMMLVPMVTPGYWWVGPSYAWEFENADPTPEFRDRTEKLLEGWLKTPFRVVQHLSGIRPATLERRPFVGFHPLYPAVGLLNGMGTKGCSLAPFLAHQLAEHLCYSKTLNPEADIHRFSKILSRNSAR
ncbi:MAG: FAD-binding oxidoreductase [Chitinophagaceae bacterium]